MTMMRDLFKQINDAPLMMRWEEKNKQWCYVLIGRLNAQDLAFWLLFGESRIFSWTAIDVFLKQIYWFLAFWESKCFFFSCFSYLSTGTPFLFVRTETHFFINVPIASLREINWGVVVFSQNLVKRTTPIRMHAHHGANFRRFCDRGPVLKLKRQGLCTRYY